MDDKLLVSVVVPVHDDPGGLARCLAALKNQTLDADQYEVVVVDDGSPLPVVCAEPGVRVVRQRQGGSYAARNAGLAAARGTFVAFTDADCIPAPDWLERGLAACRAHPNAGEIVGRVEVVVDERATGAALYDLLHGFPQERYVATLRFGATANVLAPREVVEAVGGFDPRLRSGGDKDWGRRIAAAGYDVVYAPDVVVRHPARASLRTLARKIRRIHLLDPDPPYASTGLRIVRDLLWELRPPLMALVRARRDERLPAGLRPLLRYASALAVLRTYIAWLRLRTRLGLRPAFLAVPAEAADGREAPLSPPP